MKAIVLDRTIPQGISIKDVNLGSLGDHDVRIELAAAALNHRDEWCRQGKYANLKDGVVLGSDGSGIVVEAGKSVDHSWVGKEVIINPALHWGDNQQAQGADFRILGMPDNGTLAEFIHVPGDRIYSKPDHLNVIEAAALPLGGLTAYRALFYQGDLKPGQKVLITGVGGGTAQFALQFALAQKALVYVSSSSEEKLSAAKALGAKGGFIYSDPNWVTEAKSLTGGFDLVIDSAMGNTLGNLIDVIKPGGRLVFFGATLGNPSEVNVRKIFWNQLTLKGTTMGSDRDFEEMLDFVTHHSLKPVIDRIIDFDQAITAFTLMEKGAQLGKLVLKIKN